LAAVPAAFAGPPPTLQPGILTVGINMPSPGFQVGAVRAHGVVFARGLEIDLAHALAARLGIPRVVFYQEPRFDRLIAPGPKPWDIALAEVTITPERSANVLFSIPYLTADQGVLLRRDLENPPKTIAALAKLRLCTQANTTASALIATTVEPAKPAKLYGNTTRLLDALQAGRCDAVIYDAPILATLRAQVPRRYGPLAGVIKTDETYGVVMPTGSALAQPVNDALTAIIGQGTLTTISKRWLSTDLAKLPVLRGR
ncbi:MAG: polar amino acid transport system substrate-binding protein, partial [Gaiellales bacterium]|nr:polar amino acid transport system substrate-binding protein [Gaiellales bacterium]